MKLKSNIINGKFISESKNRFLCNVLINGSVEECYIPSSSRLENYLNLNNKDVILTVNKGKNTRTKYSVFAVKYYGKYIVLNLNLVNKLVEKYINRSNNYGDDYTIFKEKKISNYKADIIIDNKKELTIVEAKGIIGIRKNVIFPSVFSERAIDQLNKVNELLENGMKVEYYFVSLSPIVDRVIINNKEPNFKSLLSECINKGMKVNGFNINYMDKKISINKRIKIEI